MNSHSQGDHHACIEQSMFGPVSFDACICGAAPNDSLHHAPPCEWCTDQDLGTPAPWWHRTWCRFVAWWLSDKKKENN